MDKKTLIERLTLIQRNLCAYDSISLGPKFKDTKPPHFCDCKYGMREFNDRTGEENGCPEMRMAIAIINGLGDKQFEYFMKYGRF